MVLRSRLYLNSYHAWLFFFNFALEVINEALISFLVSAPTRIPLGGVVHVDGIPDTVNNAQGHSKYVGFFLVFCFFCMKQVWPSLLIVLMWNDIPEKNVFLFIADTLRFVRYLVANLFMQWLVGNICLHVTTTIFCSLTSMYLFVFSWTKKQSM